MIASLFWLEGDGNGVEGFLVGQVRWPVGGHPVPACVRGLPHLYQITVGVADVATDLVLVLLRLWRNCAPRALHSVYTAWTSAPDVQEAAGTQSVAQIGSSSFLNIRVADVHAVYTEWSARGAQFLTEPKQHQYEIRCYIRDPTVI